MCHNILQEDDDIPVGDVEKATDAVATSDASVLAEQNGNLSTKLASLSLDDGKKDETTTINGNIIESEAANETAEPEVTVANKKKGKKGPANNNNNNATANSADGKDDAADIVNTNKNASPAGELINDGNGATVQV